MKEKANRQTIPDSPVKAGSDQEIIKKSLNYSIMDGIFWSIMAAFGEAFMSAFAVFLKAGNTHLSLLATLPHSLGSVVQLLSDRLIRLFGSRKKMVCTFVLLQAFMYIPMALTFFIGERKLEFLILFASLYWVFGMIVGPAWNSWMGDLVDENGRGTYFGRRNRIMGFTNFISFMTAGQILQYFSSPGNTQYTGFILLFGVAFASRLASFIYLSMKYDPGFTPSASESASFTSFIRESTSTRFGLFALYMCMMNMSVYISSAFFTPYMLKDLSLSYRAFTLVSAAAVMTKFMMMPVFGRLADRLGNRRIIHFAGFLMPLVPLLWIFSGDFYYLLLIQAYSGFIWSAFEISSFNLFFDYTTPSRRATMVSYFNVINGISILTGAFIGSIVVRYNHAFSSRYLLVFALSSVMRYTASMIFVPRLEETRQINVSGPVSIHAEILNELFSNSWLKNARSLVKPGKSAGKSSTPEPEPGGAVS